MVQTHQEEVLSYPTGMKPELAKNEGGMDWVVEEGHCKYQL